LLHQPDVLIEVDADGRLLARREQFFDGRLLGADELSEEAALGEKLVNEDRADRVRLSCGLKSRRSSGTARHTPTVLLASLA
jgi:hypothetical protein